METKINPPLPTQYFLSFDALYGRALSENWIDSLGQITLIIDEEKDMSEMVENNFLSPEEIQESTLERFKYIYTPQYLAQQLFNEKNSTTQYPEFRPQEVRFLQDALLKEFGHSSTPLHEKLEQLHQISVMQQKGKR